MKRLKTAVVGATVLTALVFATVGAGLAAAGPAKGPVTVATASSRLGRMLVDTRGRTLYLFEKDRRGASACSGACLAYWPALLTKSAPIAMAGANRSLLGTIRRADGARQVTYAGHPLYLFSGDTKRGQANGEGLTDFGAGWYVLMPSGKKIDRD